MSWTDEERAEVTDPGTNEYTALVAKARANEWRPIESAPRDGAAVLTWHDFGAVVCNPHHPHYNERGYVSVQASLTKHSVTFPSTISESGSVTHWMPLPEPPK